MSKRNVESAYTLSPLQEGMLFHSLYEPDAGVYVTQLGCVLDGQLDLEAFAQAWRRLVERHSILRTAFAWKNTARPLQVVGREVRLPLVTDDWSDLSPEGRERRWQDYLAADRKRGLDPAKAPLMRLALMREAPDLHRFLWTHHHILLDGWSVGKVFEELFVLYEAYRQKRDIDLPGSPPFRDYIVWLGRQDLAQAEAFWRAELAGFGAPTPLWPGASPPSPTGGDAIPDGQDLQTRRLREPTVGTLRAWARSRQLTPNTLIQAAWGLLLGRYSGEEDVVFGITVSGRPPSLPGVEAMVGLFINTLPLRVDVRRGQELLPWLRHLQERQLGLRQYEFSPLVEIQGWSEVPRGLPLFESFLVFDNYPVERRVGENGNGLRVRDVQAVEHVSYPLSLMSNPDLRLQVAYDAKRFEAGAVTRLLGHLEMLLESFVTRPEGRLEDMILLTGPERWQLLVEWNGAGESVPAGECLHELFEAQAARIPDAVALAYEGERLTYRDLDVRANRLAHHLRRLGVGPEIPVGVCLRRSPDLVVSLLAILKAGGAYVPLDPEYPAQRLAAMVDDAHRDAHRAGAPALVIVARETAECLPVGPGTRLVRLEDAAVPLAAGSGVDPAPRTPRTVGENLAYLLYTSGSTGVPKGVAIEHHSTVALIDWARRAFSADDLAGVLASTSINFDLSVFELFLPLSTGGTVVLACDALHLAELAEAGQVTLVNTVPSAMAELVRLAAVPASVRMVNLAGEPLRAELVREIYRQPTVDRVLNLYGPSEDTTYSTGAEIPRGFAGAPSIGRPVAGSRAYLLDRWREPVPPGVLGELYLGGPGLARGYFRQPVWTAERFGPDPFAPFAGAGPGSRLYRTGDLARFRPDGEIEFLGRSDHQVKVRGFRIELHEIEVALAAHPEIREAVVAVREDRPGDRRLVAYVVPAGGGASWGEGLETVLRADLRDRLPQYMQPSAFIVLEALPLTPNGKVDRKALPAPQQERAGAESRLTEMQELLAGIWSEVLGRERVGAVDNFFDLGGHSLLATRVISRVRTVFGVELPLRAVFERPTLAGLAERVQAAQGIPQPPPIVPVPRDTPEDGLPLSFAQQRLWLLDQLEPGRAVYNIPLAERLTGPAQVGLLERVFAEIVRRHEALRTTFASREGSPIQVIAAPRVELPVLDLSHLPDPEARALGLASEEARRPFDLEHGPLLRLALLRLGERDHVLLLTMHHIVSDGWSMGVLLREIGALLEASPLPELPVQYADFAVWQRSWLQGEVLEAQLAYWRRQLAGAPQVLELPTDRPRPAVQTFRGASRQVSLPPELSAAVHGLCRREGVTPFMALLAAWAVLLGRHSNQEDVLVGTPIAGRNRREVEDLIGFFVNTLVLRVDLTGGPSGAPSFGELLGRVRHAALDGYTHQDMPFERLVEELAPERSLAHSPLFQAMLVLQNAPGKGLSVPGLTLTPLALDSEVAKFDLTLTLEERRDRVFEGALEYNTDLFDGTTALRMLERLQLLLGGAMADPARPVAELPLLTEAERFQLLSTWNDTAAAPLAEPWLHVRFQAVAARYPGEVALIQGERRLTFEEVARRAERLAAGLESSGVGPEVVVGLRFERSPELVIAALGVLMAGGAYLPLDPAHPEERQTMLLADAGAALVLSRETWPDAPARALPAVDPEGLAYVLYTSGSTGRPKGVMVQHRALARYLDWATEAYGAEAGQGAPVHSSLAFDLTVTGLWVPLLAGRPVTLLPEEHGVEALAATVRPGADFSLVKLTPAHLDLLAQQVAPESVAGWTRALVVGGEALRQESLAFWRAHAPGTRIFNEYGPTETVVGCSVYEVPASAAGSLPIGRPIAGARLYVLDSGFQNAPVGVAGELWIGGEGVTRGYLGDPVQTAERFVPDPFASSSSGPGARLYRSGDLASWRAGGVLEYLGRTDHQLKVRGFRIEPGEIESVLRRHPAVRDVAVLARTGAFGDASLAAFVAAEPAALTGAELRALLARHLPDYMVPATLAVVDELPLTPNGKVDRQALLRLKPAPQEGAASPAAPRTPEEELMAGLWAQVLGLEQVGLDDNFFDLGGHSLLATRLIARVRDIWQAEVSLVDLFQMPTVASLLARLRKLSGDTRELPPPFERGPAGEDTPLSFAQMRLWIVDQIEPDSPAYNIPFTLRLRGHLSREALDAAIDEVVRRHEVLRTTFPAVLGNPVQRVSPSRRHLSPLVDLSGLAGKILEDRVLALAREQVLRPFYLAAGPLFRSTLLRLGDAEHVLLFTLHHIIGDGWSTSVLVSEVGEIYRALLAGRPSPLPELPIQYADYSRWQRRWLQGEVLEEQLEYWRRQLAPPLPVLDLPADRPRPAVPSGRGGTCALPLPAELSGAWIALGRQQGATLFMALLAGFYALLQRYTGQDDLVVGTDIANRGNLETEGLIGFFVNQLVLRVRIGEATSFEELLAQVRSMALEAYAHQDLPFERLVQELQPERDLARQALFQVTFALQNESTSALDLPGLTLESLPLGSATAKLDLGLAVGRQADLLTVNAEYSLDLFDAVRIERLLQHFAALLQEAAACPQGRLSEFNLLSAAERSCLLLEIGDGGEVPASPGFVPELFSRRAAEHHDAVAVEHGGEQWTYGALSAWAGSLARALRRSGVACEARVGVFGERGPGMLAAMLAVLEAGGAFVPLEPQLPDARLASILATAQPRCIVASSRFAARAGLLAGPAAVLFWDDRRPAGSLAGAAPLRREPPEPIDPHQLACVFYTSGSTGMPKGAMVEHQGMLNHLLAKVELLALGPEGVVVQNASHGFDISVWQFLAALLAGGRVVVYDEETALDPVALLRALARDGATVLETVPTLLEPLLTMSSQLAAEGGGTALPALSCLISNAETLPVPLSRRWFEQYGEVALVNTYGATECSDDTTHWRMREAPEEGCARVAVGRPIRGFRIHIVDRGGHLMPRGCVGEIAMAGVGVGRGYLGDAAKTARTFVPDPFSGLVGERTYRTGDLGRWTEQGVLEFLGRRDHQVKVRGHRVELGEIEAVLGRHPQVREVAVLAREDGHGPARLVAYVIPRSGDEPGETAGEPELRLRDFVAGALPAWMVPSAFVMLPEFPLTPNGKLDRRALPPPDARPELAEDYAAPQEAVEKALAEIWAQVIGVDRVGLHDNFFELGGDSILAIQIAALARRNGLGLTPRDLFLHQTIAELATVAGSQAIVQVAQDLVSGPAPLTPIQHWFFEQGLAAPWHFNHAVFLQIRRRLDPAALHRVVAQLLRHHDALRLRFTRQGDEWRQLHAAPDGSVPFAHLDLTSVAASLRVSVIEAAAAAAQVSLDLAAGPLLRCLYFDLGPSLPPRLLLIVHHLVVDGVSWRVLLEDVETGYRQAERGEAIELPAKTSSFKLWAERLNEHVRAAGFEEETAYWLAAERALAAPLPMDFPAGANTVSSTRTVSRTLGAEETTLLLHEVPKAYLTQIDDVLMTVLALACRRWLGGGVIQVVLESHGRIGLFEDLDLSRTVGWFTSEAPVLLDVHDAMTPGDALKSVKEQLRAVPNEGVGYGALRYLGPQWIRDRLRELPPAQMIFNYLGQLDRVLPADSLFLPAEEASGPTLSPHARREHVLEFEAGIAGGRLSLSCTYSENLHAGATIERLADSLLEELRAVIAHCADPDVAGYTPSDFPQMQISQGELDELLSHLEEF